MCDTKSTRGQHAIRCASHRCDQRYDRSHVIIRYPDTTLPLLRRSLAIEEGSLSPLIYDYIASVLTSAEALLGIINQVPPLCSIFSKKLYTGQSEPDERALLGIPHAACLPHARLARKRDEQPRSQRRRRPECSQGAIVGAAATRRCWSTANSAAAAARSACGWRESRSRCLCCSRS